MVYIHKRSNIFNESVCIFVCLFFCSKCICKKNYKIATVCTFFICTFYRMDPKFVKTTDVISNFMTSMFQFNLHNEFVYVVKLQG
jgi:hypothetical protein